MSKKGRLYSFYALAGPLDTPDLVRVNVNADLQRQLSIEFERQVQEFGLDSAEAIAYTPQYRPEDGELFRLEDFALPDSIPALPAWREQPSLREEDIEQGRVRALLGVPQGMGSTMVCFQSIDARQMLKRSRLSILLTHDTFTRSDASGLVLREQLSAVLQDGTLYFPSDIEVRRFLDLTRFFVAATAEQVEAFFGHATFVSDNIGEVIAVADKWVRRKVASIELQGILATLRPQDAARIAKGYGVPIVTKKSGGQLRIVLPSTKKELKKLLRFLDQDYLDSQLTSDHFQVNSKRKL